jgi:putative GTP pyrophosphokinase
MSQPLSGAQIDKLGDRLRQGPLTLDDLRYLRVFLNSLEPFSDHVFSKISTLDLKKESLYPAKITRRRSKTLGSVRAKLRRQSTTLHRMQDLVGCRIVVTNVVDQLDWTDCLAHLFEHVDVVDRREEPQHGYRAVHLIVRDESKRFEIQIRTHLQDLWANVVERLSDVLGLGIKYGQDIQDTNPVLEELSQRIQSFEEGQARWRVRKTEDSQFLRNRLRAFPHIVVPDTFSNADGTTTEVSEFQGILVFGTTPISPDQGVFLGNDRAILAAGTVTEPRPYTGLPNVPEEEIPEWDILGPRRFGGFQGKLHCDDPTIFPRYEADCWDAEDDLQNYIYVVLSKLTERFHDFSY